MSALIERTMDKAVDRSLGLVELGKDAPDFSGEAYFKGKFEKLSKASFEGKYLTLVFYPLDFSFVCPTELLAFNELVPAFDAAGCKLLGCSVDSVHAHKQWTSVPPALGGIGELDFPLLSDLSHTIARAYNALCTHGQHEGVSYRATFIIDGKGVLRHMSYQDFTAGRSAEETLRLVQALRYADENGEVCPAKWKRAGDPTLVGDHNAQKTREYFAKAAPQ